MPVSNGQSFGSPCLAMLTSKDPQCRKPRQCQGSSSWKYSHLPLFPAPTPLESASGLRALSHRGLPCRRIKWKKATLYNVCSPSKNRAKLRLGNGSHHFSCNQCLRDAYSDFAWREVQVGVTALSNIHRSYFLHDNGNMCYTQSDRFCMITEICVILHQINIPMLKRDYSNYLLTKKS